ncbi:hypothetical protein ACN27G_06170 [Plantactinospora sp. WMMB334]|uniref:hypothetical protein n=1 Tax=Plantactinospora sp. WMMB334 TaxID=3404119 RepID=UPI003B92F96D
MTSPQRTGSAIVPPAALVAEFPAELGGLVDDVDRSGPVWPAPVPGPGAVEVEDLLADGVPA